MLFGRKVIKTRGTKVEAADWTLKNVPDIKPRQDVIKFIEDCKDTSSIKVKLIKDLFGTSVEVEEIRVGDCSIKLLLRQAKVSLNPPEVSRCNHPFKRR